MKRAIWVVALLAPVLGGCVAGIAAGAAATAVGASSRQAVRTGVTSGPFLHGIGANPDWSINLYRSQIVFAGPDGAVTVETPQMLTTAGGYRWESERLIVNVVRGECTNARTGLADDYTMHVTADGRDYRGCGRDLVDTVG